MEWVVLDWNKNAIDFYNISGAKVLQDKIQSIIALYSSGQVNDALERVELLVEQYPNDPLLHNVNGDLLTFQ
mgnify:CR=1 FL=1